MPSLIRAFAAASMAVLVLSSCTSDDPAIKVPKAGPSPAPSQSPLGSTSPVVPEQGGSYWAVYVAVDSSESESIHGAAEALDGMGIHDWRIAQVTCDTGAEEALGAPPANIMVGLYFDSQEAAQAFADSLPAPPLAVAEVQTFCLD